MKCCDRCLDFGSSGPQGACGCMVRCIEATEGSLASFDRALAQAMVAAARVEGARQIGLDVADVDGRLDAAIARVENA